MPEVIKRLVIVSTHSRPKAAGQGFHKLQVVRLVSTHSRPKAAGRPCSNTQDSKAGFNTQPPEGGWDG